MHVTNYFHFVLKKIAHIEHNRRFSSVAHHLRARAKLNIEIVNQMVLKWYAKKVLKKEMNITM